MSTASFRPGDWVIYCKTKFGVHPGSRARNVQPTPHGEEYCYTVDKFWIVQAVSPDGTLVLRTKRGKEHVVTYGDLKLRRPRLWERWLYRSRFIDVLKQQPASAGVFG